MVSGGNYSAIKAPLGREGREQAPDCAQLSPLDIKSMLAYCQRQCTITSLRWQCTALKAFLHADTCVCSRENIWPDIPITVCCISVAHHRHEQLRLTEPKAEAVLFVWQTANLKSELAINKYKLVPLIVDRIAYERHW